MRKLFTVKNAAKEWVYRRIRVHNGASAIAARGFCSVWKAAGLGHDDGKTQ
jgi:hypothetical protein